MSIESVREVLPPFIGILLKVQFKGGTSFHDTLHIALDCHIAKY